MPEQSDRARDCFDHGKKIMELTLDRVRLRVATPTSASPVNAVNGEMLAQRCRQMAPLRVVDRGAVNQHEWRTGPIDLIGDARAVGGNDMVHASVPHWPCPGLLGRRAAAVGLGTDATD